MPPENCWGFKLLMHVRNFLRILAWQLVCLPIELLAFVVVPIALIGLGPKALNLPPWALWWQTYDNNINGPAWWNVRANGRANTYYWRLRWLLRNRAGRFQWRYVHLVWMPAESTFDCWGDYLTSNSPGHSGLLYAEMRTPDGTMYPYYVWVRQLGSSGRCILARAGWRFVDESPPHEWRPRKAEFEFGVTINRFQVPGDDQ